jgi:hypothetical protein
VTVGVRTRRLDEKFFDRIDSEKKAYWLGFLAADGCVTATSVSCTLAARDAAHLRQLRKTLGSTHKFVTIDNHGYPAARVAISSRRLAAALVARGLVPGKRNRTRRPRMPAWLLHHYVRGFFDGDGGFNVRRIGNHQKLRWHLVGHPPILRLIQNALVSGAAVRRLKLYPAGKSKVSGMLMYNGNRQVRRICEYMYADATIFLTRKRKLAESILGPI